MGEGAAGIAGAAAEGGRGVGDAGELQGSDGEVMPGGHGARRVAGPQLGGVLGEGGVADVA